VWWFVQQREPLDMIKMVGLAHLSSPNFSRGRTMAWGLTDAAGGFRRWHQVGVNHASSRASLRGEREGGNMIMLLFTHECRRDLGCPKRVWDEEGVLLNVVWKSLYMVDH
jgi:hypothetical protein